MFPVRLYANVKFVFTCLIALLLAWMTENPAHSSSATQLNKKKRHNANEQPHAIAWLRWAKVISSRWMGVETTRRCNEVVHFNFCLKMYHDNETVLQQCFLSIHAIIFVCCVDLPESRHFLNLFVASLLFHWMTDVINTKPFYMIAVWHYLIFILLFFGGKSIAFGLKINEWFKMRAQVLKIVPKIQ